jgi:hypothetical protein
MAERYQLPRSCVPPMTARRKQRGRSPSGGSEGGRARCMGRVRRHGRHPRGSPSLLKATLPTCVLSRRRLNLHQHAPRSSPYDTGAGSHASCKLTRDRRSQTATRGVHNCPAATSTPPLSPRPAGERADRHAGGMQPHQGGAPFRLRRVQHGGPGSHVTCEKLHRHLRQYRAFSTAEPVPRLEATLSTAQQCQPSTSVTGQSAAGEGRQ